MYIGNPYGKTFSFKCDFCEKEVHDKSLTNYHRPWLMINGENSENDFTYCSRDCQVLGFRQNGVELKD